MPNKMQVLQPDFMESPRNISYNTSMASDANDANYDNEGFEEYEIVDKKTFDSIVKNNSILEAITDFLIFKKKGKHHTAPPGYVYGENGDKPVFVTIPKSKFNRFKHHFIDKNSIYMG